MALPTRFARRRNLELFLLLAGTVAFLFLAVLEFNVRVPGAAQERTRALQHWLLHDTALAGIFLAVHIFFRFNRFRGSQAILPLTFVLTAGSTILLFTFRDPLGSDFLYPPFINGVAAGCIALALASRVPLTSLASFRYLTLLAALALSALLVTIGTGPRGTDAHINLLGIFQPVEFVKLLVVIFLAGYFSVKDVELRRLDSVRRWGVSLPRLNDALPVAIAVGAALAMFFLQKDLGPALILYLVFVTLFVVASRRSALGLAGLGVVICVFWAGYHWHTPQTVVTRIEMWLSPWDNHRPGGSQLAESLWALASGGLRGMSFATASPRMIPAGHTDLILAAAGETLGFAGLASLLVALGALLWILARAARNARGPFASYLAWGLALLTGVQVTIIAGATVGLLPLTGVPVPFLSFGKSATIAWFVLAGLALNVTGQTDASAERRRTRTAPLVTTLLLACIAAIIVRAAFVMMVQGDLVIARGVLTPQADGVRRFTYNRRITALASRMVRGDIVDRTGIPLATSQPEHIAEHAAEWEDLGLDPDPSAAGRYYPLGRYSVHVLGHTHGYWTDPRTMERLADTRLRGYRNAERVVLVDGNRIVERDYSAIVPLFRDLHSGPGRLWREASGADRTVQLPLDARLQVAAATALEGNLPVSKGVARTKGAAVVLDPATGGILALVSLPTYDPNHVGEDDLQHIYEAPEKAGLDRARFEIYPPGSSFKVVTAAAALATGDPLPTIVCRHKGMVQWEYGGTVHRRIVTDDEAERAHGRVDMGRALAESCNVYFATVGAEVGAPRLFDAARRLRLELSGINSPADLEPNLPDNAYGQARIAVAPVRMAAVAASVVNGGMAVEPWLIASGQPMHERALSETAAAQLREWMLDVVRYGTGRVAAVSGVAVGGKTGTAQTKSGDGASHAWFIGFAYPENAGPERSVAFAFLIENGGYGGGAAARAAHDFVRLAFGGR